MCRYLVCVCVCVCRFISETCLKLVLAHFFRSLNPSLVETRENNEKFQKRFADKIVGISICVTDRWDS